MTKYIITDPCYIIADDVWQECCKQASSGNHDWNDDIFNAAVTSELTKLSGSKAWATGTGIGDWTNEITGPGDKILQSEFCADSGMVCVCKLTDKIEANLKKEYPNGFKSLGAIIECDGNVDVTLDRSDRDWTVVIIKDATATFSSLESESDLYDDEDDKDY